MRGHMQRKHPELASQVRVALLLAVLLEEPPPLQFGGEIAQFGSWRFMRGH